jgi:hypothetical protein
VRVLARVGGDAVRVDGLDHPEVDPARVAVAVPQDVHDLVARGLVAVDRANHQAGALGVRITDPHRH